MSVKILIVDDHEVVRQGVRSIISKSRPHWEICGEASNGEEAIQAAQNLDPDIVLLDITMPVMNGFKAAPRIAKLGRPVLMFTMHESETIESDVRKVGACGYVLKSQAVRDLILAIESVLAGGTFFGPKIKSPKASKNPSLGIFFRTNLCFE
jgi:DNA-binding NarL/FixJ family response regulator